MTDTDEALRTFFRRTDEVFHEYDRGYMDADAAMSALETYVADLRDGTEVA
ncbi:hypothetical protein [Halomarina ordinaria]|uniref:DUF357 domain-containing protein n=1 Tax=Halomarina ordinaria TaxID=3033939 RepID=A0ABD5UAV6_9EURY|nr:hypothetical protein [Halomarina sp. PSRA2]